MGKHWQVSEIPYVVSWKTKITDKEQSVAQIFIAAEKAGEGDLPPIERQQVEVKEITVKRQDLYPAMFARIGEFLALERENHTADLDARLPSMIPGELVAPDNQGAHARAVTIMRNALLISDESWRDAATPREQFIDIKYNTDLALMAQVDASNDAIQDLIRLKARAHALDTCLGWFLHALRIAEGGTQNKIVEGYEYRL